MKRITIGLIMALMVPSCLFAQRIQQKLGRAVVAVTDDGKQDVLVTWRKLAQEPENCTYNLYKRAKGGSAYTKVNSEPIAKTNFQTTRAAVPYNTELAVTMVSNGVESEKSAPFLFALRSYKDAFFEFNFETNVLNPNNYKCSAAYPVDLDGNGEIDAVLANRLHAQAGSDPQCDNTNDKIQMYTLDGECLWTVDAGPNMRLNAGHNDLVTVYDINCDGKCEVILKTSDGTRFWDAANNTWGGYANGSASADTDGDGIIDYKPSTTKNPPFYISIIDGKTGKEIDCNEINYSAITDGSDSWGRNNRADYYTDGEGIEYAFLSGRFNICYFDGIHPSLSVHCLNRSKASGHHYYVLEWKYDWTNGKPSNWHHSYTWAMRKAEMPVAEFHQCRVADVDGDGIDELLGGGFAMNSAKGLVSTPQIGHGDRFDVSDIDPELPGMEVYAIQQSNLLGQIIYNAATGEHIKEWYLPSIGDVGRGRCMDVDLNHKGYEVFSTMGNLYDCKGNVIKEGSTPFPVESVWWDGDLERELIASPGGNGYGTNVMAMKYNGNRLIEFSKQSEWAVHAGWAIRPAYVGDMTGDWREELILMKQNDNTSTGLVGYSTDIATDHSLYTLQEDPHYRLDCTGRGYYQSPNTSFYLGGDMPYPPLPAVITTDLRWTGGASWSANGGGFTSFDQAAAQNYADGKSVIFDLSGNNSQQIAISGTLKPKAVYVMSANGHDYTFGGTGTLAGDMELWKSMQGTATFNCNLAYTGRTVISEGTLCVNGAIAGPVSLRAKGSLSGVAAVNGGIEFEEALNYEGCRLMPGNADNKYGVMTFGQDLTLPGKVYVEVNAGEGKAGKIMVNGNLTLSGDNVVTINQLGGTIAEGKYVVAECTGTLTADAGKIAVRGLDGVNYEVVVEGRQIVIMVNAQRAPQTDVTWIGNESNIWDYKSENFEVEGNGTSFVTGDKVVFGDASANRNITVNDMVVPGDVTFDFDNGTYTLSGNGGISGDGGLAKSGKGELVMNLTNSNYTGKTVLNEGTLTVDNMADGGKPSAIGAAAATEGNLVFNGGTLKFNGINMATDRIVTVNDTTSINISKSNGALSLKGMVKGDGYLIKEGSGLLNFTYAGENPYAGIIVRAGKIGQGEWNATFAKKGSPMILEGGTVQMLDVNNSATRPILDHKVTAKEGTVSTIMGTTRGAVNGSFHGKGTVQINSFGVRSDIGANFSDFEGTLIAEGENFRLMDNVTDMKKTTMRLVSGSKVWHSKSNSGTNSAVTTYLGALESGVEDCSIGTSSDIYEIGFNNTDASYSGLLKAKTVTKRGAGVWTLRTSGSTAQLIAAEGTLQIMNDAFLSNPASITTSAVKVQGGATLTGIGCAAAINAETGAVVAAGYNGGYGTLKTNGMVTMKEGSTLAVKVGLTNTGSKNNDKFKFGGRLTHSGDTLLVILDDNRELTAGEEITIFTGNGGMTGTYVLVTQSNNRFVEWDDSALATEGKLKVLSVTGISGVTVDSDTEVNVYSTDGILLRSGVKYGVALDGIGSGVYVINGRKVVKQ